MFMVLMLVALLVVPASVSADSQVDSAASKYVPGELIVKFKDGVMSAQSDSLHKKNKTKVKEKSTKLGVEVVEFDKKTSVEAMMKKYKHDPNVEYVEPNYYFHASWIPNDPYFSTQQWGPQKIQAPAAWDITRSSSSVKIAIVDTGVQSNHPDLSGKVINGYDFVDNDTIAQDGNGHGTHCAGIAAALTNNGVGISGVAPNAQILAVRVLDNNGSGTLLDVADGIIFSADSNAQVISLSLGGSSGTQTLKNAVDYAWNNGSVVVAAAGNSGSTSPSYPAYYTNSIAVASTDSNDVKSYFSNYGSSWVDVTAPGSGIYSTYTGSSYRSLSGTSMATPHVAGIAALLAAQGKNNQQIRAAIENSADKISGTGTYWKYGRVNAYKAVTY
ncbi:S8 family peptidase [Risungbinella massiliensis]|uniref:S8 family peptidase n=1 Tax=Risungbinella massiliensis TaxID=1329796 RepID=UPI00389ACC9C